MAGLKAIAEATGFSVRTVKRALTGHGSVRKETRDSVLVAARRLEYRPNLAARSLKTGTSSEIGALMHSVDELHMEKLLGMEAVLRQSGYSTHVLFALSEADDRSVADALLMRRPAGVALFPSPPGRREGMVKLLREKEVPYVVLDSRTEERQSVRIDRARGVEEAVRYLAANGRRRIAYVGPTRDRSRLDGYERAVKALGLPANIHAVQTGTNRESERLSALHALVQGNPRPDAIQAYSDTLAMEIARLLHGLKIRIPQDIAVVGFDNRAFTALACPALTTVAQPGREVGQAAATMLLGQIADDTPPDAGWATTLPTRLIVRDST